MQYSMFFHNTHHTFGDKIGFVVIRDTFRASLGESCGLFGVLLGILFEVLFLLPPFEGNRLTAGSSESGCVGPPALTARPHL